MKLFTYRRLTKIERRFQVAVQVIGILAIACVILLKCDRWFYDGYFQNTYIYILGPVDYKFPLLDSYWEICESKDYYFALFIFDWLAYFIAAFGILMGNFIITWIGSTSSMVCCFISFFNVVMIAISYHGAYVGFDPLLDFLVFIFGHTSAMMFASFQTEEFYSDAIEGIVNVFEKKVDK